VAQNTGCAYGVRLFLCVRPLDLGREGLPDHLTPSHQPSLPGDAIPNHRRLDLHLCDVTFTAAERVCQCLKEPYLRQLGDWGRGVFLGCEL
jgi:hypothetical protein